MAKAEPAENKLKEARGSAELAIHPSANAAMVIEEFGERFGHLDAGALAAHLKDGLNDISKNDLHGCAAMLYCQAQALQPIFVASAHRATLSEEWFPNYEAHMRLALKAQSQCRVTLETLATIKNPQRVAFVQQANIAHGPQQVNNGAGQPGEPSRAREAENPQNELLEAQNGERLDFGAPGAAGGADSEKSWERSTGPKTLEGKARVSRNVFRGGWRGQLRELSRLLREQFQALRRSV